MFGDICSTCRRWWRWRSGASYCFRSSLKLILHHIISATALDLERKEENKYNYVPEIYMKGKSMINYFLKNKGNFVLCLKIIKMTLQGKCPEFNFKNSPNLDQRSGLLGSGICQFLLSDGIRIIRIDLAAQSQTWRPSR